MELLLSLLFASPLLALESRTAEFDKFFHKGDTVAFLGDSITHGSDYHAIVQTFFSPMRRVDYHRHAAE